MICFVTSLPRLNSSGLHVNITWVVAALPWVIESERTTDASWKNFEKLCRNNSATILFSIWQILGRGVSFPTNAIILWCKWGVFLFCSSHNTLVHWLSPFPRAALLVNLSNNRHKLQLSPGLRAFLCRTSLFTLLQSNFQPLFSLLAGTNEAHLVWLSAWIRLVRDLPADS